MSFESFETLLKTAEHNQSSLAETILQSDLLESGMSRETSIAQMRHLWAVMQQTSADYCPADRSNSGLVGGDAEKMRLAAQENRLIGGTYLQEVITEALKTAECNACMKRIVAAPTAGSCGVLPAVLLPLRGQATLTEERILESLYISAGFGQIAAARASLSGAEGGCQAEIGVASAMAAAALAFLFGGTNAQCADAFAMAMANLLGLVCDPVAGLVEVPCVKRNVIGAVNAVSAANMALAGITSRIPADDVLDAMRDIGDKMSADLKETGVGGLAGTPSGQKIIRDVQRKWHAEAQEH